MFDDSDDEASARNKEVEEPRLFGDLLAMSWKVHKVKLDHDYLAGR